MLKCSELIRTSLFLLTSLMSHCLCWSIVSSIKFECIKAALLTQNLTILSDFDNTFVSFVADDDHYQNNSTSSSLVVNFPVVNNLQVIYFVERGFKVKIYVGLSCSDFDIFHILRQPRGQK